MKLYERIILEYAGSKEQADQVLRAWDIRLTNQLKEFERYRKNQASPEEMARLNNRARKALGNPNASQQDIQNWILSRRKKYRDEILKLRNIDNQSQRVFQNNPNKFKKNQYWHGDPYPARANQARQHASRKAAQEAERKWSHGFTSSSRRRQNYNRPTNNKFEKYARYATYGAAAGLVGYGLYKDFKDYKTQKQRQKRQSKQNNPAAAIK